MSIGNAAKEEVGRHTDVLEEKQAVFSISGKRLPRQCQPFCATLRDQAVGEPLRSQHTLEFLKPAFLLIVVEAKDH